jgi:diacylglycerol kinase (ATP)
VAVLTNPAAGGRANRSLVPQIVTRLGSSGRELTLVTAHSGAEAEQACRVAVDRGATALVAVGGDGTLHAAIQAVAGTEVPFAVVPAGSGNDFAAALGVPADPLVAADQVAQALAKAPDLTTVRRLDLARVTGTDGTNRWFAAVFGAGFDAIVNERANRMRWPRGDRRYDVAILLELLRLRPRHYRIRLDDGAERSLDAVLVAVGNSASYGGGIRICPGADPADGLLDVVIGHRMGRITLASLWPRAYRGTHLSHRLVESHRVRTVRLDAPDVVGYADGERCLPLPVTITCEPGSLCVLTS